MLNVLQFGMHKNIRGLLEHELPTFNSSDGRGVCEYCSYCFYVQFAGFMAVGMVIMMIFGIIIVVERNKVIYLSTIH